MSTTPSTPASTTSGLLPLIEGFANLALVGLSAAGVVPVGSSNIAAALETSINSLVTNIQSGSTTTQDVMAGYGVVLAALNAYKTASGSNAALITKIDEYSTAVQAGMTGFVSGESGFNAANYAPVTPIA